MATLGAVLIPNLVQVPIAFVLRNSDAIVQRLSPEMVAWMIVIGVAVYMVASFYIVGAGTRLRHREGAQVLARGAVDIDDVVHLIGFIFSGGYEPCDTDGNGIPDC